MTQPAAQANVNDAPRSGRMMRRLRFSLAFNRTGKAITCEQAGQRSAAQAVADPGKPIAAIQILHDRGFLGLPRLRFGLMQDLACASGWCKTSLALRVGARPRLRFGLV